MLSTSSVQDGGAELPLCPKIGAALPPPYRDLAKRFDAAELRTHFAVRQRPALRDDGDAGFGGDLIQRDVAANPPSPACRGRERLAFDGGRFGESKLSLIVSGQYASIYASSAVCVSRLFPMNSV